MKNILLFLFLFLTACSSPRDFPPSELKTETHPLYLATMTHMEGGWKDDRDENLFLQHVEQLRYGMDLAEEYDAILTVESEKPFARANTIWDVEIMKEVLDRGHGVGTHCDIGGVGQREIDLEQMIFQLKENKKLVDDLVGAENNHGCSGAAGKNDWAIAMFEAGFDYINGMVGMHLLALPEAERPGTEWTDEFLSGDGYHNNFPAEVVDRIYLMQFEDTTDYQADETGIVVSNGELGRVDRLAEGGDEASESECPRGNCPFTTDDVDVLVEIIQTVDAERDPSQIAKLAIYMPASNFVPENEDALRYLFSEMQKLQEAGTIEWASQWEIVQAYLNSLQ